MALLDLPVLNRVQDGYTAPREIMCFAQRARKELRRGYHVRVSDLYREVRVDDAAGSPVVRLSFEEIEDMGIVPCLDRLYECISKYEEKEHAGTEPNEEPPTPLAGQETREGNGRRIRIRSRDPATS